jgi:hypothetical protein
VSRESGVGSRESGVGSRKLEVGCWESGVGSREIRFTKYDFRVGSYKKKSYIVMWCRAPSEIVEGKEIKGTFVKFLYNKS